MDPALLDLDAWDRLSAAQAEDAARGLALPAPWCFLGVEPHALGDQRHLVAFFDWGGARFALIPGGTVTLGYDRTRPFAPSSTQRESWEWTCREWRPMALDTYLDKIMTPLRTVALAPFLLEVHAHPVGRTPAGPLQGNLLFNERPVAWQEVADMVAAQGFRLPTSDEWEHACAAGSRTLFRWGDTCPVDGCSTRGGKPIGLAGLPNAFGLRIGMDSYAYECCADRTMWCGGDGGGAVCGGLGCFASWLTLASAYRTTNHCPDETHFGIHVRRAFTLP